MLHILFKIEISQCEIGWLQNRIICYQHCDLQCLQSQKL